ncbi:MAG: hypothetical protein AVDCRST_MAG67-3958 [uncultured Solirubrobacteraceae bacterium]|uniref:Uncharacterized protein n=1 Tax=uncultured Solirubrobacteraceae bacterium TaxID=1162706 RepID=A0A6J4TQW7_9ACTN|nr:MAG: hypothetical protein AVDCRST_MAG67-3958 [uncultured Solirubrobacteraceae bacterium]
MRTRGPSFLSAALLCVALAPAGCGDKKTETEGNSPPPGETFAADHLPRFLLKPSDLPSGYKRQRRSAGSPADLVEAAETAEERSFDQLAPGLKKYSSVTYRKQEGDNSNSPASFALLYETPAAAANALPAVRRLLVDEFSITGAFEEEPPQRLRLTGLGDGAAAGVKLPIGPFAFFLYVWRARKVVVTVGGADTVGDMSRKTTSHDGPRKSTIEQPAERLWRQREGDPDAFEDRREALAAITHGRAGARRLDRRPQRHRDRRDRGECCNEAHHRQADQEGDTHKRSRQGPLAAGPRLQTRPATGGPQGRPRRERCAWGAGGARAARPARASRPSRADACCQR